MLPRSTAWLALVVLLASSARAQPAITSISPTSAAAGGAGFALTVNGTGFGSLNLVQWNGANLPTTFVSATRLTATVSAADIAAGASVGVRVRQSLLQAVFSNTTTFTVNNPVPTLSSLSPTQAVAGSATVTLALTGTNFNPSSFARWGSTTLPTTFVSSTQLQATVSATLLASGGTTNVSVRNPAPAGGTSSSQAFSVLHQAPVLAGVSPNFIAIGSPTTTLTLTGSGFVSGATARWNGTALPTTFISTTSLTAGVDSALLASGGTQAVTVENPSPTVGPSGSQPVTVGALVPTLTSITPNTIEAAPTTDPNFSALGTNFAPDAVVLIGGVQVTPSTVSATSLHFTVPRVAVGTPGTVNVRVQNPGPGGGLSGVVPLTKTPTPPPTISGFQPASVAVGMPATVVGILGTNFRFNASVRLDGTAVASTFVSETRIDVSIPAFLMASFGSITITVETPSSGLPGVAASLPVLHTLPAVTGLGPASVPVGPTFNLTVTGTGFEPVSTVLFDGNPLVTTFVNATTLTAPIPPAAMQQAGDHPVQVTNPAPGGGTSAPMTFSVVWQAPFIVNVSPLEIPAASTPVTLSVLGAGLAPTSFVEVVSPTPTALATTLVATNSLSAVLPGSLASTAGPITLRIVTPAPGGGTSSTRTISIVNPLPAPTGILESPHPISAVPTTVTIVGARFVNGISASISGTALATTFLDPSTIQVVVPPAVMAVPLTSMIELVNPAPTVPGSALVPLTLTNPVPALAALSPAFVTAGDAGFTLTVTGSGFHTLSAIRWDGGALPTTFLGATQLSAPVPSALLASPAFVTVEVYNGNFSPTVSNALTFEVRSPQPTISALNPPSLPAGSPTTTVTVTGANFLPQGTLRIDGIVVPHVLVGQTQLQTTLSPALLVTPAQHLVEFSNPAPGTPSASANFTVLSPRIDSLSPAGIPVLPPGAAPAVVTINGAGFIAGVSVGVLNNVPVPTTFVSSTQLTVSVPGSIPQRGLPGGITVAVQNNAPAPSNSVALDVGGFSNAGSLVTHPLQVLPGMTFALLVEGVLPGQLFTLIADLAPPPPTIPFANQVLGVLGGAPLPLVDGLGVFGPSSGASFGTDPNGTAPFGTFVLPGITKPNPPVGLNVALQAAYLDPSSPVGLRLSYTLSPLTL